MEGPVGAIGSSVRHSNSSAEAVRRCHVKNARQKRTRRGEAKGLSGRDFAVEKTPEGDEPQAGEKVKKDTRCDDKR